MKKDDLESLFFLLVYLIKGQLPWGKGGEEIFKKEARTKAKAQVINDYLIDVSEDLMKFY